MIWQQIELLVTVIGDEIEALQEGELDRGIGVVARLARVGEYCFDILQVVLGNLQVRKKALVALDLTRGTVSQVHLFGGRFLEAVLFIDHEVLEEGAADLTGAPGKVVGETLLFGSDHRILIVEGEIAEREGDP